MDVVKQGPAEIPRSAALVGPLTHGADMYGVRTVYLREKGLVPLDGTQAAKAATRIASRLFLGAWEE